MKQGIVGFLLGVMLSFSLTFLTWPLIFAGVGYGVSKIISARDAKTSEALKACEKEMEEARVINKEWSDGFAVVKERLLACQNSKGK